MIANSVDFDTLKANEIVSQLLSNAAGVRYGVISVTAKLHEGRIVEVSLIRTEQTRDLEILKNKKE